MIDVSKIKAISLDLDDTLWPIWPVIERAELALHHWLEEHAPMTAALFSTPAALRDLRNYASTELVKRKPELKYDLSALRRESIRLALFRAKEDPLMAEAAFDVFMAERNKVVFYDDALPALERLRTRYPLVALSNGNANVHAVGLGPYFSASISAREFGVGKPDAKIFYAAAGALDLTPSDMVHIGDDASLDVLGALNAGMQAVWLNRGDHLWAREQAPSMTVSHLHEVCDLLGC